MLARRLIPVLAALGFAAAAASGQDPAEADVQVELEQFGVGSTFRPGEIAAIRLKLTSALDEPTPCWVQWELPNAEGDVAEYGRSITLNPGTPSPLWLYAPVPPHATARSVWTVRVFEQRDGRRRRELGGARISAALANGRMVPITMGMIAVVGRAKMGLDDYGNPWNERLNPPGAHEETRIVSGILPQELPDRWEGLRAFEAVMWSDALPQQMRADSANALREYVSRGGHLVITLPEAGNPWGLGARGQTWLDDLLVQRAPRKDEGVLLSELTGLLSKSDRLPLDFELGIRVFRDAGGDLDAIDNFYRPLIALDDGRVVAVQRIVGLGHLTILGIDLASRRLASMRIPQADAFWNRILGRRQDTPQADEIMEMRNSEPRMLARGMANDLIIGDERLFERHLNKTGRAGLGVFAALLLFAGYLLLAGPGGYFLLKQRGWVRHSWLAFAMTAGLFTAVAWGGVRLLREQHVDFRHVTFLDHVARGPTDLAPDELLLQRAICWGSLYMPGYGDAALSLDSEPNQRDLLLTWAAPRDVPERFPNVDRYTIDEGRSFCNYSIPTRATATQLYSDWLGALSPEWGGMIREEAGDRVRFEKGATVVDDRLSGTLIHDFPGPLTDVRVLLISGAAAGRRRYDRDGALELEWVPPLKSGEMNVTGHMWILAADSPWYPGNALSLSIFQPSGQTTLERNLRDRYIKNEEGDGYSAMPGMRHSASLPPARRNQFIEMLTLFHQLDPPKYLRLGDKDPETVVLARKLGRELDLSSWLTSPCLLIIGYLENTPTPVPLTVDGRRPESDGLTVVRWICPLPPDDGPGMVAEGQYP